ncbi:translocase of chloroplast 120 [Cucumis melo var. makuwa]|uniref:Translocase of chloroplast 120 n=1 Tax=Cucumis melo var. makuwa TaxID=1194695 RepID=A0A5D3CL50_CUCMM|nr:translocase of chloroplast 120 [Cucumis melo var. makuwa]TYK12140.1 translocase of chloroplast 120 [Cucumis melo var. makuwa]
MENGVEVVDGLHDGEKKFVGDGVSRDRVDETVVVGSHESKDTEGEDVFEEALDGKDHLIEQSPKYTSVNGDIAEEDEGNDFTSGVTSNHPNNAHDEEKFEEAIEAYSRVNENPVVEEQDVNSDKETEGLDGKLVENAVVASTIDERGTEEEAVTSELNESKDDELDFSRDDSRNETLENGPSPEVVVLKDGDEDDLKFGPMSTKSENNDSNNLNVTLPSDDELVNKSADLVGGTNLDSTSDFLTENRDHVELNGKSLGTESSDHVKKTEEPLNAPVLDLENLDITNAEQRDDSLHADLELPNNESEDMKETTTSIEPKKDDNKNEESSPACMTTTSQYDRTEEVTTTNQDHRNEEVTTADENHRIKEVTTADENHRIEEVTTADENHQIEEVKNVSTGKDSEKQSRVSRELNGTTSADQHESMGENEIPLETVEDISASEKIADEKIEKIQGSESDVTVKEDNTTRHQHPVDSSNNGPDILGVEKTESKDKVGQDKTQVNRDPEIRPASIIASSSGKSTNPTPPARPAGLGRAAPLLEPAPRVVQPPRVNGTVSHVQMQQIDDPVNGDAEENDDTREQLQMIRVKFLRLAHRLGQTPHNVVVAQVLYRLGLAEQLRGRNGGRVGAFSFDRASAMAEQLEAAGQEPLDFSCTIMVLGKTGVGKSATINSIFDEVKFSTDAFQMGTKKVQDVVGTVQGIKVRVIDTPGLLSSWSDQRQNEKILLSVKRFIKKTPPDIVLYLDRLDMQTRDFSDMPLLRTITEIFGPSIWFNAIVVLTHAASAPPDGPNGTASSYDMFVTQRSHVVQQAIRQAAGDMRLMNPVSLVENHSACRTNRAGQRVLPNGQVWKPHLLLLSFASKILAEANTLLKLQDSPPGRPFTPRSKSPPLPFLLSSLLQSRPQVKLPEEQFGDDDGLEDDLDESSDSENESEYDELPPFKRLTKAQVAKLSKAQKKAYFDELEYREKLFMKKQLKEEKRRRKMLKKMAAEARDQPRDGNENVEEDAGGAASVPVPMPDLALPASFDSDNPTHRYRYLDSSNQWLIRPVLETHGWDHDVGYEGINAEKLFVVKDTIPISFSGQVTKDKKDANVQIEMTSSIKHGETKASSIGFDMQTVGKDLAYTLRGETTFINFRKNKAIAGLSVALLGDALSAGFKVEDKLIANKRFRLVVTGGAMTGRGDVAYGGSLEAQLRDKDYPLGRSLSTLGLSVMDWHGDLAIGCNVQSQVPIGRSTNLIARVNLNNRGAGQVSFRLNSSEQLQIAIVGLLPLLRKLLGCYQYWQDGQ